MGDLELGRIASRSCKTVALQPLIQCQFSRAHAHRHAAKKLGAKPLTYATCQPQWSTSLKDAATARLRPVEHGDPDPRLDHRSLQKQPEDLTVGRCSYRTKDRSRACVVVRAFVACYRKSSISRAHGRAAAEGPLGLDRDERTGDGTWLKDPRPVFLQSMYLRPALEEWLDPSVSILITY